MRWSGKEEERGRMRGNRGRGAGGEEGVGGTRGKERRGGGFIEKAGEKKQKKASIRKRKERGKDEEGRMTWHKKKEEETERRE